MRKFVINGRQLCGPPTGGVQRFIREICAELDKIVEPGEIDILVPKNAKKVPEYKNMSVVKYGKLNELLWEQTFFPLYLLTHRAYGISPCNIIPMLYPKGIAIVHDVMPAKFPEFWKTIKRPIADILLMNYWIAAKHSTAVVTVSQCSKQDIMEIYGTPAEKIHVIGNGWQHIQRIECDDSWMQQFPQLEPGSFYFSLSVNRPQKNFKWIYEVAKRNPNAFFAIAGASDAWQKEALQSTSNILLLGYISDGMACSLIKHCKALLFPSIYEGFGIPPMEAMALGTKAVIANVSCMPEIYRNSAYYINPYDYDVDLDALLKEPIAPATEVLTQYGWDISARKLYELCKTL